MDMFEIFNYILIGIVVILGIWIILWLIFKILFSIINVIFDVNLDEDFGKNIIHIPLHFIFVFPLMLSFIFLRFKIQRRTQMNFNYWRFTNIEHNLLNKFGYSIYENTYEYEYEQQPFGYIIGNFMCINPGGNYTEYKIRTFVYNK